LIVEGPEETIEEASSVHEAPTGAVLDMYTFGLDVINILPAPNTSGVIVTRRPREFPGGE
jgi:hypothetical protein